jgi:isochorismate synthase
MQEVKSRTYSIFNALSVIMENKLVLASYRLPGASDIDLVIQKDQNLKELSDLSHIPLTGGFLIAPFRVGDNSKTYLIRPDIFHRNTLTINQLSQLKSISTSLVNGSPQIGPFETDKENYLRQIEQTIRQIRAGEYDKVVLSRVKIIPGNYTPELVRIFQLLCESYPNAFVYLFHIKGQCWMGATPEPLICTANNQLFTVSLAGTRPYSKENTHVSNWNHKERVEQEYVTKYIERILSDYSITHYSTKGPYTKKAGKILHLRTDFYFSAREIGDKLPALIEALHPTSAVCGIPMEKSLNFITSLEKHDREYYTGFLGPVGMDCGMQLFVNLRCMKVLENQLLLYIGGGITSESIPEDEWEETEIKADTLLSIVQQI